MENIIIMNIKREDLRQVSEIAVKGWQTAYRGIIDDEYLDNLRIEDKYQKQLKNYDEYGMHDFIVAKSNNEVVGFCRYRIGNDYYDRFPNVDCEICALYVKPELKRKGIGKQLVTYVKNKFCKMNLNKMIIWCLKENYPSRAFYEKMGGKYCGDNFIEIGNKVYEEVGFIYDLKEKDRLNHVRPTKEYKEQAINYINEFYEYKSDINGSGGLHRYLDDYEAWLEKLEEDRNRIPNEEKVPAETYFLVRETDDKIVGMINIRLALNEKLKKFGGHIGYSIRPTEREKGYNKINLYLGLKCCQEHGIKEVLMDCDKNNPASAKTIQALGGILIREYYDDENAKCIVQDYKINVDEAIKNNKQIYENKIERSDINDYR